MWARGIAIRPVPRFAVVEAHVLASIENELASDDDEVDLDDAFQRFERTQPHLSAHVGDLLGRRMDETALALGYFLAIAVWLAFDRSFQGGVTEVSEDALRAVREALALEDQLRAENAAQPLDVEDVLAQEQPAIVAFLNEHLEAALEGPRQGALDVDDIHKVYRLVVLLVLSLSYAVAPPPGDTPEEPQA